MEQKILWDTEECITFSTAWTAETEELYIYSFYLTEFAWIIKTVLVLKVESLFQNLCF